MFQQTNEQTIEPMLLTPRQAARALNISERTLWQRTKDGVIPAIKLGHLVRYSPDDLRHWIRQASTKESENPKISTCHSKK